MARPSPKPNTGGQAMPGGGQRGFTLMESLVSILVFSVGLLGLAALQSTAKQASFEAAQRTQAAFMANDIIERMRTNAGALDSYDADGEDWTKLGNGTITSAPTPDCESGTCTPAQMAARDRWAWEQAIDGSGATEDGINKGGLVSPTGCIRQNNGEVEVAIAWRGRTEMTNPGLDGGACTADGLYGTDDNLRRLLLVRTFIGG